MEFLRFGSSIPGGYWGCCAVCIIQNFKMDPDTKASIQIVSGDSGTPILDKAGKELFVGPTYRDIFNTRIRIGTFGQNDMPNHVFLAVLTQEQIDGAHGKKWMAILKEAGFEFIRTTDNSVYTGANVLTSVSPHPNHIFGLFRNIGGSAIKDPFTPPKAWTDLPEQTKTQMEIWKEGKTVLMTEADLVAAKAPVIMAGLRSKFPPQEKAVRTKALGLTEKADPFADKMAATG